MSQDWAEAAPRLTGLVRADLRADSLVVITGGNLTVPSLALPAGSAEAHADRVLGGRTATRRSAARGGESPA